MQIGIHQIENLLYLLCDAAEVIAYFNRLETEPKIEDVTALLMQFTSGAVGYVTADHILPRRFEITVHGTNANAFFDIDNDGLRIQRTGETAPSPVDYEPADHLLVELEGFSDAAAEGRKPEIDGAAD